MAIDGFVEGDPFDPQDVLDEEVRAYETVSRSEAEIADYVRARKLAYAEVFSPGETTQDAIDFVMLDLAVWSRAFGVSYDPRHDERHAQLIEGRKEMFYRIFGELKLPYDTLYVRYVNVIEERKRRERHS